MGAYIIHFDDKPWQDLDDEQYYRCKEIPWFSTIKTTISRLTPYTEDAAYAHGYTEAEAKYREIRDELEKQAYQRGLADAWDAARKICTNWVLPDSVLSKIFGMDKTIDDIMKENKASEAIEKIRAYEQRQEEINVGDEVVAEYGNAIVVGVTENCVRCMYSNGKHATLRKLDAVRTGRHFPEIAEVLAKMKKS